MKRAKRIATALIFTAMISLPALAVQVPPVAPLDFDTAASSPDANPLWLILAGEGFWGAIVIGLAGLCYRFLRPHALAWLEERRFAKLFLAAEACVVKTNASYVEGMKAANADGKLTVDERQLVFQNCRQDLVLFMQSQGVDIVREYGDIIVDAVIELLVAQVKNPLAKAAAGPFSASSVTPPLPPSL